MAYNATNYLGLKFDNAFDTGARDYLENFEKPLVEAIIEVIDTGIIFIKNKSDDIAASLMI